MRYLAVISVCIGLAFTATTDPTWAGEKPDRVSDEWCGFSLAVPKPWARAPFSGYTVPGTLRFAWSGGGETSVVVFVREPGETVEPRAMLGASVSDQRKQLAALVQSQVVPTV